MHGDVVLRVRISGWEWYGNSVEYDLFSTVFVLAGRQSISHDRELRFDCGSAHFHNRAQDLFIAIAAFLVPEGRLLVIALDVFAAPREKSAANLPTAGWAYMEERCSTYRLQHFARYVEDFLTFDGQRQWIL